MNLFNQIDRHERRKKWIKFLAADVAIGVFIGSALTISFALAILWGLK